MKQQFVDIHNIPTSVTTWGPGLSDNLNGKEIVLCIPGNPGLSGFYVTFLETIHQKLGLPVWIISHSGHEESFQDTNVNRKIPALKNNEHFYDAPAQIEHKVEFIRKYIPKDAKLHMVGHSIGTYMILQLLKDQEIKNRIKSCSMLFPTIYNLPGTPLGLFCNYCVKPILPFVIFLSLLFSLFPKFLATLLLHLYYTIIFVPKEYVPKVIPVTIEMIRPSIIGKVFHLGFSSIQTVQEMDLEVIEANKDKIKFYYGAADLWAPISHCKKLLAECPKVDAQICQRNFNHEFVLKYSVEIGEMVAEWISNWRNKN